MREFKPIGFAIWLPALVVVCLTGLACQRTPPIPAVVQGASMAPNWLGEHQLLICRDCRFPIRYQLDVQDVLTKRIVCPNCGYADNLISDSTTQAAQSATIARDQPVSRWDVVAVQLQDSEAIGIKRVIGLSNEKIEIRNGDLYADGKKMVKPWEIQKNVRMLVFDTKFQPQLSNVRDRWSPHELNSGWLKENGCWKFAPVSTHRSIPDQKLTVWNWLNYHHWRCCLHSGQRDELFPLEDLDSFNPSSPRSLNAMMDACFEIRFRASSDADLGWRILRGSEWFEFRLNVANNRLSLLQHIEPGSELQIAEEVNRSSTEYRLPAEIIDPIKPNLIEVSTFDGQFLVFVNGHPALSYLLSDEFDAPESKPDSIFFGIGGSTGRFEIERVRIWRDIYYLPVRAPLFNVPADSFLVLGDNVPVSVDSRHWKLAGILGKNILGIVKPQANR